MKSASNPSNCLGRRSRIAREVTGIWQDVQDGILRNASVGAQIHKMREDTKEGDPMKSFTAIDWTPMEVSLVAVPADPGAGFRAAAEGAEEFEQFECEINFKGESMNPNAVTEPGGVAAHDQQAQAREGAIRTKFASAKRIMPTLPDALCEGLIADNSLSRSACADRLFAAIKAEQDALPQQRPHHLAGLESRAGGAANAGGVTGASVTRDHAEGLVAHMSEALACRFNGKAPSDGAREFIGARTTDLARICLESAGVRVTTNSPAELIRLAGQNSTSDYPHLLVDFGRRMLLQAYQASTPQIQKAARQSTAVDFRVKSLLRLGEAPSLELVNESGEFHYGSRVESRESYQLRTYGKIFSLSRQALVNDDLSAFVSTAQSFASAAIQLEGSLLTKLLTSNPIMEDGNALFHASHNNLLSPALELDVDGLSAARLALRTATGLDGVTILDLAPRFLLVPAALETAAQQVLSEIFAVTVSEVNPFAGPDKFSLLVDPRLDAYSSTAWYLFTDPATTPVLEYSYLSGQEGLFIESRMGFEVDGIEIKSRLDYGVGAVGFRGAVKSPGA